MSVDTAYRTAWRAFVFYAYTRRVAFASLRSQGLAFAPTDDADDGSQLPICSPKSMYRLAVKYGNAELQFLAKNDIWSKLSTQNVLPELFSTFTAHQSTDISRSKTWSFTSFSCTSSTPTSPSASRRGSISSRAAS
ncbi:hypothetical protein BV20DRAFT_972855 [Pilatotrama ljubarskyi]|nr:hypothetical protein BV20DRAFT_972855 [Pilatotrama ljubarskyi]